MSTHARPANTLTCRDGRLTRRNFLVGLGTAGMVASTMRLDALAQAGGSSIKLLNGRDLTGWYFYIIGQGRNNDPKKVFAVEDGMLHISGEQVGALITEKEYSNYRVVVEYKWGAKMWPPREKDAMDGGLMLHCGEKDAAVVNMWPRSIQCQIYQGSVGDFVLLAGDEPIRATIEGEEKGRAFNHIPGAPAMVREAGVGNKKFDIINHYGKDPNWKNEKGFFSPSDAEKPHGEWNTMEVIAKGDTLTCNVNGRTVNKATALNLTRGRIGLQSEMGEMYIRRVELFPL
jgi:hypothetical protein